MSDMYKPSTQKNYKDKFLSYFRAISNEESIDNHSKRVEWKRKLIHSYNEYINYITQYFESFDSTSKSEIAQEIEDFRQKLLRCFKILHISHNLPSDILEEINIHEVLCEHEVIQLAKEHEKITKGANPTKEKAASKVPLEGPFGGLPGPFVEPKTEPISPKVTSQPELKLPQSNPPKDDTLTVDPTLNTQKTDNPSNTEATASGTTDNTTGNDNKSDDNLDKPDSEPESGNSELNQNTGNSGNQSPNHNNNNNFEFVQPDNNEMDQLTLLSFAAKQINKIYSGDPLELNSFINSIKLLKQLGPTHLEMIKTFVMTKLSGKALECVPAEPASIDVIIESLQANIKPDSSKVVEGKMMALKHDTSKSTEFATEAEKLAEALQRSLVVEGISQTKAKSMAVDKTVEMCRQTANTTEVRTIIASTTFADPKEVIAKFVVESATVAKDNKILKFGKQNYKKNYYRKNYRGNYRKNQDSNQNNDSNWRGKGRKRGRGKYKKNQNDHYVNVANAENSSVPSGSRRESENHVISFQRVNDN